jgi:hypothetical protein
MFKKLILAVAISSAVAAPASAIPGEECIINSAYVQCTGCGQTMEGSEQYGHLQTCENPR